jgi:hypothetical protein
MSTTLGPGSMGLEVGCMAVSISEVSHAEPSSDFPTQEDCGPCARLPRGAKLACAVGFVLVIGLVGFLFGRARTRRLGVEL